jgi:transposase InsO family protein
MPWEVWSMSESRSAFVALVRSRTVPVAEACRRFGISRKTGYKWLARHAEQPDRPLADQSRRPRASPARTPDAIEREVLAVRAEFGWGARKIHALLRRRGIAVPGPRTVTAILRRHQLIPPRPAGATPSSQRFERGEPNALWQLDFKGPLEVARRRFHLFDVLDDHSRYALASELVGDKAMATAWDVLWRLFGEVGLPEAVLCDNAFASRGGPGLSWFDARLVRLGITPGHGRPYHPQTQGKVERWHGTLEAEILPRLPWDDADRFAAGLDRWRREVYNGLRPHESLGDVAPVTRWRPSVRRRPVTLPEIEYATGSTVRKVMHKGEIAWRGFEILVGSGLYREWVRVEERDGRVRVWYGPKQIRDLPIDLLRKREVV